MIGQYLSNTNENTTVAKFPKLQNSETGKTDQIEAGIATVSEDYYAFLESRSRKKET
jgi:hypothetical protein